MRPRVVIAGPTAVGKTAVGVLLAQLLETEIVSADSMQVYRGMDIGTAKPTTAEQAQVRFHGIDVTEPDTEWTLADYQSLGTAACDIIAAQGKYPLVVGGTGLYVRSLTTVLDIPCAPPDEAFRAHWRAQAEAHGAAHLHVELAKADPDAASRIHVNDIGRTIRALEVYRATGTTLTDWHTQNRARTEELPVRLFGLNYADRSVLYARIDERVDMMFAAGFADEVRELLARGYPRTLKPMQSLGYRHLASCLAGEINYADTVEQIKRDTRHFARRQLIWFRADSRITWLEASGRSAEQLAREIKAQLTHPNTPTQQGHATE